MQGLAAYNNELAAPVFRLSEFERPKAMSCSNSASLSYVLQRSDESFALRDRIELNQRRWKRDHDFARSLVLSSACLYSDMRVYKEIYVMRIALNWKR